jgi:hypothetical protein
MLELALSLTSEQALAECQRRGLVVRSERELSHRPGSNHWHLGIPGRAGTLELDEWRGDVWVKVHPLRDGGWASDLAQELAADRISRRTGTESRRPGTKPADHPPGR